MTTVEPAEGVCGGPRLRKSLNIMTLRYRGIESKSYMAFGGREGGKRVAGRASGGHRIAVRWYS